MNVFYTEENINLCYWGWCTKQQLSEKSIFCSHNVSELTYKFIFKSEKSALDFYRLLKTGSPKEKIIEMLKDISKDPEGVFEFLLRQEIIE